MNSLIDANVSSNERRDRLKPVAKAALDLAQWAAEGRNDYFLAAQIAMLVHAYSRTILPPVSYPDLAAVLDFLGLSIQTVVGKATKTEGVPPERQAVEPIEETNLEHAANGSAKAASK